MLYIHGLPCIGTPPQNSSPSKQTQSECGDVGEGRGRQPKLCGALVADCVVAPECTSIAQQPL
jgi:hypothetical protein